MHNHHTHNIDERRLRWALILTAGFMVIEVVGGIISGSLALLADAGHMLTDSAALGMAWLAARWSRRPADELRSYGYHRLQILAAFVNGMGFIALVIWICIEAMARLFTPITVQGDVMLTVAAVGLLVNLVAFAILRGQHSENLNVRGAAVHVLGDLAGSVAAILAAVVILGTGWTPIDPLLSIFVALLILRSAWIVVRQSAHILLEGTPPDMDVALLRRTLTDAIPEIRDLHHVHVWSLTPERRLLTMHVDTEPSVDQAETLRRVKEILADRFGINHSTIQIESERCPDHPRT
ncbi:MAG: cation diffusion facilitator family transporter [Gammaproteobacteria bacterium]|nr:cation diffusion facilitator family transporter [Gammaproteobacteria bacterium]